MIYRKEWAVRALTFALSLVLFAGTSSGQATLRVERTLWLPHGAGCSGLRQLLLSLDDGGPSNRYHVLMEPGMYGCGSQSVVLPAFVSLEGGYQPSGTQGNDQTILIGTVVSPFLGVLHMLDSSSITRLKVHNQANGVSGGIAVSAWNLGGAVSVVLREVTLVGSFSDGLSLKAIDADVTIAFSTLLQEIEIDATSSFRFSYGTVDSVIVESGGVASCYHFSEFEGSSSLGPACPPPAP